MPHASASAESLLLWFVGVVGPSHEQTDKRASFNVADEISMLNDPMNDVELSDDEHVNMESCEDLVTCDEIIHHFDDSSPHPPHSYHIM